MTDRPTTWVGLWLQAMLVCDWARTEKLRTRLNSGNRKGWRLDEPAVVRATFDLAMDRHFDGRYDPRAVNAFATLLREGVGEQGKMLEIDLIQGQIRKSLNGEGPSQDDPNIALLQHIHTTSLQVMVMESGITDAEIATLIVQAEDLARSRGWNPPLGP
jgi:hypothetical protein